MEIEVRKFQVEEKGGTICGYASVYGVAYNCGDYAEIIARGAFDDELKRPDLDVVAQIEHEGGLNVIGRTTNGTLELRSDHKGLYYCCSKLPDTQTGRDILTLVKDGYITNSSIQYAVVAQTWDFTKPLPVRTVRKVKLLDVAPVSIPASPTTSAFVRAKADHEKSLVTPPVPTNKMEDMAKSLDEKIQSTREGPRKYKVG